ncbi:MAG: TrbI/VirB10 family protein [Halothiobacillaceae bacterium]
MSNTSTIEPAGLSANGAPIQTRPQTTNPLRVSGRALLLLAIPAALAVGVVMYNIFTRGEESISAKEADKPKPVESAMDVAESINQNAYRPVVPALQTQTQDQPEQVEARISSAPQILAVPQESAPNKPLTPEELAAQRLAEERLQRLSQAMGADTKTKAFQAGDSERERNSTAGGTSQPASIASQLAAAGYNPAGLLGAGGGGVKDDPNGQADKQAFLKTAQAELATPILPASVKAARSAFEINSGTVIPAVLVTGLNSDLPGEIIAQVSESVFDSATGNHLLIPKGAKLFGRYDSQVSYGQQRLLVAWQRVIFPNGSTLEIGGMGGVDKTGSAGFEDQVDNHYWRLFTGALLTSIFSAGIQLSQPQTSNNNGVQSTGQTIGAAVGQQIGQLGVSISQKNLAIAPTIVIRQGYRFSVMVNKDVVFPGAYQ